MEDMVLPAIYPPPMCSIPPTFEVLVPDQAMVDESRLKEAHFFVRWQWRIG